MNDTVRDLLRALPSRLKSMLVFPSTTGETPVDARNYMNRVFVPALEKARINGFLQRAERDGCPVPLQVRRMRQGIRT